MQNTEPQLDFNNLKADCTSCFGLCCVALYFSCIDGFPIDKVAGQPCINLRSDFSCRVHANLKALGYKGCTTYECLGAGQKASTFTFQSVSWRQAPTSAETMFRVFVVMEQLHEMLWYLMQARNLAMEGTIATDIEIVFDETVRLTFLPASALLAFDIAAHRASVSTFLQRVSTYYRSKAHLHPGLSPKNRTRASRPDLIGQDLRRKDLRCADLRGALLIAANLRGANLFGVDLIGADLRDAELSGADLTNCLFLTQAQINSAKGDKATKLPHYLSRPGHW